MLDAVSGLCGPARAGGDSRDRSCGARRERMRTHPNVMITSRAPPLGSP